jgi:hypothetical protein
VSDSDGVVITVWHHIDDILHIFEFQLDEYVAACAVHASDFYGRSMGHKGEKIQAIVALIPTYVV